VNAVVRKSFTDSLLLRFAIIDDEHVVGVTIDYFVSFLYDSFLFIFSFFSSHNLSRQ
jgi:hypothetical protein